MNKKIMGLVILIAIAISSIAVVSAADVDVVRDFDNTTIYHVEKSDYGSQKVSGIENNAKLVTTGTGSQKTIETENGYYEYSFLSDENNVRLNSTDKVKFNYNRTLTANYEFYPFMFAEINIIDLHGHTGSDSNYPAMKTASDSITKTFKEYTDVEEGYRSLYILDIDTNTKYQPGDKFTITYQDVANTGLTKMIKTFQYVYVKDIVIENIIVENRTIFNDTIVNRTIFNDTIVNRTIFNDTIVNRTIFNDTIVNRTIENITYVNKTIIKNEIKEIEDITEEIKNVTEKEEIKNVPEIIPTKEVINELVKKVVNNTSVIQNNENKTVKVLNNNTTKTNTITTNINDENNTSTPTSNNIKMIKMMKTGNPIAWLVVFFFIIMLATFTIRDKD